MGNLLRIFFTISGGFWTVTSGLVYLGAMFAPTNDDSADLAIVAILLFMLGIALFIIGEKLPKRKISYWKKFKTKINRGDGSSKGGGNTPPNISFTNPRILDVSGNELTHSEINKKIRITADATNSNKLEQEFAFYVRIRDTEIFAWITGTLSSGQSFSPELHFIPDDVGSIIMDISLFDNIENKNKLSESLTLPFIVEELTQIDSGISEKKDDVIEILKIRLAKGEITKEEYDELNSTLGNEPSESTNNNNDDKSESQNSAKWV